VVICLERGADLHMTQLMPLPLTVSCFSKIQIDLPFWYRLTRVVLDKWPLNSTRKLLWFEITKMLIAVPKINLLCHLLYFSAHCRCPLFDKTAYR